MRLDRSAFLTLLLATSACRVQDTPIQYETVAIEKVGEKDTKGELLHRYVEVEGYLSMPSKIFALSGGGTWVTLFETPGGGKSVETSVRVGKTGASRLITKADMYDENTLKIADRDGVLMSFSDRLVIQGELRLGVGSGPPDYYIDVRDIRKASPR